MKTQLGHYEIVSELGRGGMGVVYKGFEPALNRHVAIKELSPALAHDESLVERFLREARSMAALNDPNIIQIYFIGQENGQPFFVMEFVEGDSLSAILKREGRIEPADALKIIHQTAKGLATAHDRGVIHRDIKPGNLMITSRGTVKIADFGIALATQDLSKKLTSTGEFVGTPGYLSPEVCMGKAVDQRSDIFSLGIVLFEMLSGRMPFTDESPLGLMLEVVKAEVPDIRSLNSSVDTQTYEILSRMVAKEPGDRFQSCHDLVAALEAHPLVAKGGPIKFKPALPPADATVVGAPTPAAQARRAPTPPPVVSAAGVGAAAAAPPAPPAPAADAATRARPSVLERSGGKSGGWKLPVAIAAAVLVLLGGTAFAFRGYLGDFAAGYRDGFLTGKATNPVTTSDAAPAAGLANAPASAPFTTTDAPLDARPADVADAAPAAATTAATDTVASTAADASTAAPADAAAALQVAQAPATAPATVLPSAPAPSDAAAAAPGEARPVQVAKAAEPKPVAPPSPPRVVVVAIGDSAITSPAQQRIEEYLDNAGFDVVDAGMVDIGDGELRRLLASARRHASMLVVVRAEAIGSEQLQYYGQSSTLYSAYLSVRAYHVPEARALGAGSKVRVDFAALNADQKAIEAVEPELGRLERALAPYRRGGRG